jgi:gluconolactonase
MNTGMQIENTKTNSMNKLIFIVIAFTLLSCNSNTKPTMYKTTGTIIQYDEALAAIIDTSTKAEIIAEGYQWSEGPLWIEKHNMLLFSDVPMNTVYKWTEEKGAEVYLKPSGYTGAAPSKCKEPGSNGLTLDTDGHLVLCQHGDRAVSIMDAPFDKPAAKFITLVNKYNNKKLNSPNDLVFNSHGELFFTDPPYGLFTQDDTDSAKELKHNGVYKVKKDGTVILLVDSITRPNGLAFFPGEKQLLIANSDPAKPVWYIYDVVGDSLINGKIFFDASAHDKNWNGLPDGFKINKQGIVFATGPGGVYIFNKERKKLGVIRLENSTSNCALSQDEKILYVTNDRYVLRIKLQ